MISFLCAITITFDGAAQSTGMLQQALLNQTCNDFIHICITNGESPLIKQLVCEINNPRFIYDPLLFEKIKEPEQLLINICKRRAHGLQKYDAQRYVFLDADLEILDDKYFSVLQQHHDEAPILFTKVQNGKGMLDPVQPHNKGSVDIANFSFNKEIAKNVPYPVDFHPHVGFANDWRFLKAMLFRRYFKTLPIISARKNGNKMHRSMSEIAADGAI